MGVSMLIKFLKHSKGSGHAAINYLLGERDHKGELRAGVKVLRGDPYLIADLIDSLDTVHRYTSGVIAWHPEDNPSEADIEEVLNDFEKVAFPGLGAEQYTYCAVLHIEADGSLHIHLVSPRVELTSGKSLNIAQPGHEHYYSKWRDAWNAEKGWRSPADINLVRSPKEKQLPEWKFTNIKKEIVQDFLTQHLKSGTFNNRDEMISFLNHHGEITRVGADYISFKPAGAAKSMRLKGPLFSDGWTYDANKQGHSIEPNPDKAAKFREQLKPLYKKRAAYNANRYKYVEPIIAEEKEIQYVSETADSYPELIAESIERAAEVNRIANELNQSITAEIADRIGSEDSQRRIDESKQAIARTEFAIEQTKSRVIFNGGVVEKLRKTIDFCEQSIKIVKKLTQNLFDGVSAMLNMTSSDEFKLMVAANAERLEKQKKEREEKKIREEQEFVEIVEAGFKELSERNVENEENKRAELHRLAIEALNNFTEQQLREKIVDSLMERGMSFTFANDRIDAVMTSDVQADFQELLNYVVEDLITEQAAKQTNVNVVQQSRELENDNDKDEGYTFH